MFVSSAKEVNSLISNGISNIYVKVTIQKKWTTLKSSTPGQS